MRAFEAVGLSSAALAGVAGEATRSGVAFVNLELAQAGGVSFVVGDLAWGLGVAVAGTAIWRNFNEAMIARRRRKRLGDGRD